MGGKIRGEEFKGRSGAGEKRVGGPELAGGAFGPLHEVAADEEGFVAGLGKCEVRRRFQRKREAGGGGREFREEEVERAREEAPCEKKKRSGGQGTYSKKFQVYDGAFSKTAVEKIKVVHHQPVDGS